MPHEIPILDSMPNMKQHECEYSELEAKHRLSMMANQHSPTTKDEDCNINQHECEYSELEAKHRLSMMANQQSPTKNEDCDRLSMHRRLATEDYHEIVVGLS